MALSLSASVKAGESPWRLSVEGGCFGKAISLDIRNSYPYDWPNWSQKCRKMLENGILLWTKNVLRVNRSDYRKYLPGQFIRIRLKIEQNCRLFLDIFISAIMNDLFKTCTSRLKVDANVFISSEIGLRWRTILGHPQLIECILSLAHGSEQRGSDVIFILWKTDLENCL